MSELRVHERECVWCACAQCECTSVHSHAITLADTTLLAYSVSLRSLCTRLLPAHQPHTVVPPSPLVSLSLSPLAQNKLHQATFLDEEKVVLPMKSHVLRADDVE
jgi:hypothetical protein